MSSHLNLSQNDYKFAHPPGLLRRLSLSDFASYQPQLNYTFYQSLASFHSINPDCIYLGNGLADCFAGLFHAYSHFINRNIIIPQISWPVYTTQAHDSGFADIVALPHKLKEPISLMANDTLLAACAPSLIIAPWVNNPTGLPFADSVSQIDALALRFKKHLFFFDLAYLGFSQESFSNPNLLSLIRTHSNIILGFSFSKFFGMPGIRLGYLIAQPSTLSKLHLTHNYLGINTNSLNIGHNLLANYSHYLSNSAKIIKIRDNFITFLSQKGYPTLPSQANFVLVDAKNKYSSILKRLAQQNISVKTFTKKPLSKCFRITPAPQKQLNAVIDCF